LENPNELLLAITEQYLSK